MDGRRGRSDEEREYYSLSERVYRRFAPFYDLVAFPLRRLRHQVATIAVRDTGSRVLDVATGTGAQALAFAEVAREVIGVDLSEAMLRIAQRKNRFPNLTFRQADATELPFDDASFDVSCVSFALHEMPLSMRDRTLREMARVTRPGGTIVVVDYSLPQNALARAIVFHLVKLYERDHYADFVRADLPALFRQIGIRLREDRPALRGLAKIAIGINAPLTSRPSLSPDASVENRG